MRMKKVISSTKPAAVQARSLRSRGIPLQLSLVHQGLVPNLVEGIGCVGDQFSQKDLLVGVESVDDQREKLVDFRLEGEGFDVRHFCKDC